MQVILHLPVCYYRACDELLKHGDIHAVAQKTLLGFNIPPVHIDKIRDALEGVERNADRQNNVCREVEAFRQPVEFTDYKACVFKCTQADKVKHNADDKEQLFMLF